MRWNLMIPVLFWFIPVAAFGFQDAPKQSGDVYAFLNAVALSYNNYHPQAREEFQKYKQHHPDDLLSRLRMLYDRTSEVHFKDMDQTRYKDLLLEVDEAIDLFEINACVGTDLAGIAENTIDCDYIGAALYSFRVALLAGNESWRWKVVHRKVLRADDDKFFYHAKRSKSLQAQFLLGVHENELSKSVLGGVTNDPNDRHEALKLIRNSMKDGSPFADDIWFYVLRQEIDDPAVARSFPEVPPAVIIARLQAKYPNQKYPSLK